MSQRLARIETTRLRLRPLTLDSLSDLHRLWTEPGVRKYLWDDEIIPLERTESIIEASQTYFERQGFGLWAAANKVDETLVGFGGFWFFHLPPKLELLYGIATAYWNRGLATEVVRAMLEHGFDSLAFPRIEASTDVANRASARVLERVGMRFWKLEVTNEGDLVYYVLDREAFTAARGNL